MWKIIIVGLILVALIRVGIWTQRTQVNLVEGDIVKIEGKVEYEPRVYWDGRTVVNVAGIEISGKTSEEIAQGDRLRVIGKVESRLIAEKSIKKWLEADQILILGKKSAIEQWGAVLRGRLREVIIQALPHEEGALMAGLVWGDTRNFTYEMREMFKTAGLSHLVAASGFNVTLLASWVTVISARLFNKKVGIVFVILSILLYMYLAGLTTPILRAGLMAIITVVYLFFGRKMQAWYTLVVVGIVMVIVNSDWIASVSFQLSMLATAAIIYGSKGNQLFLIADFKSSIWVYIFTIPILVFHFGTISLWGVVANVLVLWLVPVVTQIGMIASLAGIMFYSLAQFLLVICFIPLKYILIVSNFIANFPMAKVEIGTISLLAVIIYYIVLASICIKRELHY